MSTFFLSVSLDVTDTSMSRSSECLTLSKKSLRFCPPLMTALFGAVDRWARKVRWKASMASLEVSIMIAK